MTKKILPLIFLFALVSGCGHYGPLYLPKDEQKSQNKTKIGTKVKKTSEK